MNAESLIHQVRFNQHVLSRLLEGLTHEESLQALNPEGHCINWTLGHILTARDDLLKLLQVKPHWSQPEAAPYRAQVQKLTAAEAHNLSALQADLRSTFEQISQALRDFEPKLDQPSAQLSEFGQRCTNAQRVGSFMCHEAYHAGQIGLMRRRLGKPGLF